MAISGNEVQKKYLIMNNVTINVHEVDLEIYIKDRRSLCEKDILSVRRKELKDRVHTLHRIVSLVDIDRYGIHKGMWGGYIEDESNLSQEGDSWVGEDAMVFNGAIVSEDALVDGKAHVEGSKIKGFAHVGDHATIIRSSVIYEHGQVFENATVRGSRVYGYGKAFGNTMMSGDVRVFDHAQAYDNSILLDSTKLHEYAKALENSRLRENADAYGQAVIKGNSVLRYNAVARGLVIFLGYMCGGFNDVFDAWVSNRQGKIVGSREYDELMYSYATQLAFEYAKPEYLVFLVPDAELVF